MTAVRDLRGRFLRIPHDPRHPWVLFDAELREPVIRCSTRLECREHHRHQPSGATQIILTRPERR